MRERAAGSSALTGLSIGCLAIAADYLTHALAGVPLLPEQAGFLVLKVLPLGTFASLLGVLGVLARPLLLFGSTVAIIVGFGVAAMLFARVGPRLQVLAVAGSAAVLTAAIGVAAAGPSDSPGRLGVEVVIFAAAPLLVYAVRAQLAQPQTVENFERRRLLRSLLYGAVGLAVVSIAVVDARRFVTALAMREGNRPDTELTPIDQFYIVSKNLGGDPVIDAGSWRLSLPDKSLTYDQLLALPGRQVEVTLSCISNEVGGTLISNGIWKGPMVTDVLAQTAVPAAARYLLIESADGYTESLPLQELTPDHILATHLDGKPLPAAHGFPARFIFPNHYGMKQPKWVTRLRLAAQDQRGYWEQEGWNEQAIVKTMSRIDAPLDGAVVPAGTVRISGIAFAGARRISAVEVSSDGGRLWTAADLDPEFSPYAWRFWHLDASLTAGRYAVVVRARDGAGSLQTASPAPTLPDGADGLHTISLAVP